MKKNLALLLILFLAVGLMVSCSSDKKDAEDVTGDAESQEVIAVVNDEKIFSGKLERNLELFKKNLMDVYNIDIEEEGNEALLASVESNLMQDIIYEVLLCQEAANQGIVVPSESIEEYYEDIKASYPSEEDFADFLKDLDMKPEDFKEMIHNQFIIEALLGSLQLDINVTSEEIEAHYAKFSNQYDMPEQIAAKHLLFETEEEALNVLAEIKGGVPFNDFMEHGDDLGYFQRGMMVPEFEAAAFALPVGGLGGPVETMFGFHLITVYDKVESRKASLDDVAFEIREQLIGEKQNKAYEDYLNDIYNKSDIEILYQPAELEDTMIPY